MRFKFIHAERANYPVRVMCRVLRVSTSGYYAQMKRAPSRRQCEDGKLKLRIQAIHAVVFYIESRRFLIRDSPRPATTYEQKTGGADGVKGA